MSIDWSKPIEAVHEDGRVRKVDLALGPDATGNVRLAQSLECGDQALWFKTNGRQAYGCGGFTSAYRPWTIRNVAPDRVSEDLKQETKARMIELVRRLAGADNIREMTKEARAIVAELPPIIDRAVVTFAAQPGVEHDISLAELARLINEDRNIISIRGRASAGDQ